MKAGETHARAQSVFESVLLQVADDDLGASILAASTVFSSR